MIPEGAVVLTAEALAAKPRWDRARAMAIPGRCRGVLLRGWQQLCTRRWGPTAVSKVRAALGPDSKLLPDKPGRLAWLPLGLQIRVTDVIIEELLGGDALGIEAALRENSLAASDGMVARMARTLGPAGLIRRATEWQAHLYDVGRVRVEVRERECEAWAVFEGSEMYENPTWRGLQLATQRMVIEKSGRGVRETYGVGLPRGGYGAYVGWR
ncbi:MAG: hypothetical protein H6744_13710 [Deltaproteobacteria bacterium]|nr:hypothetical protein [Deltaproteobacteria bacterium]